jgi:stage V sporulation protein SpoVS
MVERDPLAAECGGTKVRLRASNLLAIALILALICALTSFAWAAGAVTKAAMAIAIARAYLEQDNLDIAYIPEFIEVEFNKRIAVRFRVDQIGRPFPPATPIPRKPKPPNGTV